MINAIRQWERFTQKIKELNKVEELCANKDSTIVKDVLGIEISVVLGSTDIIVYVKGVFFNLTTNSLKYIDFDPEVVDAVTVGIDNVVTEFCTELGIHKIN